MKRGVHFLPTCGAALEKQSAAALPSLTPPALPSFFVWGVSGRWPQRAPSQELAFRHPVVQSAVQSGTVPSTSTLRVASGWSGRCSRP